MEFRVLGPVEVVASGRSVDVGPPQRCAVLAALAVDAGRPVTVETLIDRVWGDRAPDSVRRALQAHLTRIRRSLESAGTAGDPAPRLVRRPGAYLLEIEPDRVDLHRFRRLCEQARGAGADRVALLSEALGLWRAEPLAGLVGEWAVRCRNGWRQQYLDAMLSWAEAELGLGNATAVIGPLTDLVAERPLLEPLVALLMRALHSAGHAVAAFDLYAATRTRLIEELGTEPGAELRRVHQGILRDGLDRPAVRHQPAGSATSTDPAPAAPTEPVAQTAHPVPAQLPRDVRGFTGRRAELAQLDDQLDAAGPGGPLVICAVAGAPGVGKTALAVHWAHQVRDRFPGGQLYVNLRGFDPGGSVMDPAEAVRRFLDALHVAPQRIPADLDAQSALYRSEMSGRRMIVVLDNARDTAQVRPLLPGTPGCLVLVTSRNQLTGLVATDGARPVHLDLPSPGEARDLLARRLDPARLAAEPAAVDEIITRCARLPLALTIVAARAATHPHLPLPVLAAELHDTTDRLDALTTDDPYTDVRAVLSWSYQALTPAAARLFRLLGLHPGPDVSGPAAASLAGLAPDRARATLTELVRANLLVEHTPGRYARHDLLRAYATELVRRIDPDADRHAATHRMVSHYLQSGHAAALRLDPTRNPISVAPPPPGVTPERPADQDEAMAWFAAEHAVLVAAIDRVTGFDTEVWQLAWTMVDYLDRRGYWRDGAATQQTAVAAADRLADPHVQARVHRLLARAYNRLARFDEAQAALEYALDRYAEVGDRAGQGNTHQILSAMWERRGDNVLALHHTEQSHALFLAAGDRKGQAAALNGIGWFSAKLGDHERALVACRQALSILQEIGDRVVEAATWDSLGFAHLHLGHHAEAITCFGQALNLNRQLKDRYHEADALTNLGDALRAAGDLHRAREAWHQAVTILDELGHRDAARVRARLDSGGESAGTTIG